MEHGVKRGKYSKWSEDSLRLAVKAIVVDGRPIKSVSKEHGIPRQTLQGYVKRVHSSTDGGIVKLNAGRPTTLGADFEEELVHVLQTMADRLFGLSPRVVRQLVFRFCEINGIDHRFNAKDEAAGKEWMRAFMKRHPTLSLRVAEATSIQRAIGFNRAKVDRFFNQLEGILFDQSGNHKIPAVNIFNVDESGLTVCHKPGKVIAVKGKRSVGGLTSGEKGKTVTVVCCTSASGVYIPPMMIFPRQRVRPEFVDRAPTGTIYGGSKTGWITSELFEKWFIHFVQAVRPDVRPEPVLLILDGHSSHTRNLAVINKARESNVIILSLPSHCTHRMQPLDLSFFKSLNAFYDQEAATWLRQHPGRAISELQVAELFGMAYEKAATVKNAQSGFRKSGISPFNRHIFSDEDFAAADSTDRPRHDLSSVMLVELNQCRKDVILRRFQYFNFR
jgi:transposase